ncbi:AraC family transcriptional regulator [Roseibacillus persicicus]|nr:DNA-binding transcriptional regulator [Roseibacillus persicicus]
MAAREKRVGLMVEALHGYGPRILNGLARWVHSHPGWRVSFFDGERSELARMVATWQGDGIICTISDNDFLEAARSRDIPVVNVAGRFYESYQTSVISDNFACGRLAAEYFLNRGFKNFALAGATEASFSSNRATGYVQALEEHGHRASILQNPLGEEQALADWLKTLPLPCAIFCPSDRRAASVLEAAYLAKLNVPEDLSVLGIGDHKQLCELCTPPLSSVDCDMELRGFEAASLLSRLMAGEERPNEPLLVAPTGVVTRRSSDIYAFEDPDLVKALRYIYENAHKTIKVNDVVAATSISRRSLENRFRHQFHHSLHDEIWRVHFDLAKHLLTTTDLGLQQVAEQSGFRTASGLANLFKQKTGVTPRTYRSEHRR